MVTSCIAVGCTYRYNKADGIGIYRFPRDFVRRQLWIRAVRRRNWNPTEASRICGRHFLTGKPSMNKDHPDYVPSIFSFTRTKPTVHQHEERKAAVEKLRSTNRNAILSVHLNQGSPSAVHEVNSPDLIPSVAMGYCADDNKIQDNADGSPSHIYAVNHPDYVPCIKMDDTKSKPAVKFLEKFLRKKCQNNDSREGSLTDINLESLQMQDFLCDSVSEVDNNSYHWNHSSNIQENNIPSVNVESEIFPKIVQVSSYANEFIELHSGKESTHRTCVRNLFNTSVNNRQSSQQLPALIPVLNNTSVCLRPKGTSLSTEPEIKKKEIIQDNERAENDGLNISQDVTEENHFRFEELIKHLGSIHKPNYWWTVSCCKDFVMCAKWDPAYFCQRRVVIAEDLTAKVFVRKAKIHLDGKVNSCESVSSLLQIVDEL